MSLYYVSQVVSLLIASVFGLALVGLGGWIWVRGYIRVGGLLAVAGLTNTALAVLASVLYLLVPQMLGPDFMRVIGILLSACHLFFWVPLLAAIFFAAQALPRTPHTEDLDATLA